MLGRGIEPFDAACAAVHLHGRVGELLASELTEHSVTASDIPDAIPAVLDEVLSR